MSNANGQSKSVVDELRGYLLDEIKKLRDGTSTAASANAVTNAAGKYFQSIKLELELCKVTGRTPRTDILGVAMDEPPALGAPNDDGLKVVKKTA